MSETREIVQRLRSWSHRNDELSIRAAEAIEDLQARLSAAVEDALDTDATCEELEAEIAKLKVRLRDSEEREDYDGWCSLVPKAATEEGEG